MATAPDTCGVACEVPDLISVLSGAATNVPGASSERKLALCEKQATLSAPVVASVQVPPTLVFQLRPP